MKRLLLIFFLLSGTATFAQVNDYGIWTGIEARKKFARKFTASVSSEVRLRENSSQVKNIFMQAGLSYEPWSWLEFGLAYRLDNRYRNEGSYFDQNHRIQAEFKLTYEVKRFSFSYRNRFQSTWKTEGGENNDIPELYSRHKGSISYKIPQVPLFAGIAAEMRYQLNNYEGNEWDRFRASASLEYRITKVHRIEATFIYQRQLNRGNPLHEYITRLKYVIAL